MAASVHNPSRRALLGAAASVALVPAAAAAAPLAVAVAAPSAWALALAAYEAAEGELVRFEAMCRGRPFEEQGALEVGFDARSDVMYAALRRLLSAPAPDLHALAAKIGLIVRHDAATLTDTEDCMEMLERDARRLAAV